MVDSQENPKARRGWMKYVLIVSLGVNLVVAGMMGGAVLRGGPPERMRVENEISALGLRIYARALDGPSRKALGAAIRVRRSEFPSGREVFLAHKKAMASAISADPYDSAAVAAELSRQAGVVTSNVTMGHSLLLERLDAMSPAQRQDMAEKLLLPPRKRGERPLRQRN